MTDLVKKADLPTDVQGEELAQVWVDAANGIVERVAPCLASDDPAPSVGMLAEAKLILIGMISRWAKAGAGGVSSEYQQAGPYGQTLTLDTSVKTGYNPWPSEIQRLQDICKDSQSGRAFSVDTLPHGHRRGHWASTTEWVPLP